MEQPFALILASASPRRRELLGRMGYAFETCAPDVDEHVEGRAEDIVKTLAVRKARAAASHYAQGVIIASDTLVSLDGAPLGKPADADEARRMLRALSGDTHQVVTAVSVWMIATNAEGQVSLGFRTFADAADVTFHELSDERIAEYLRQGESFDKAGAYAAQGEGAKLIKHIEGDRDTVIGLPVARLLREFPDLAAAR